MAGNPFVCVCASLVPQKGLRFWRALHVCFLQFIHSCFCELWIYERLLAFHHIIWYYLAFCQFTAHLRSKFLILWSLYLQHLSVVKWIFCASPLLGVRQCRRMTCKSKLSKCALWLHNIFSPSIGTAQIDNRWWVGVVVYVWFWCKYAASRQ